MNKNHVLTALVCLTGGCATPGPKSASEKSTADTPKLSKPVVRKIWIPPEIRAGGGEWVEGHYMYRIEKETKWSR